MLYNANFKNINDVNYLVTIISQNDSSNTPIELKLGDEPFVVDYQNGEHLFKPVKYSSATVKILSKDYLFDLYSSVAQGTSIKLIKSNIQQFGVAWCGYITPNIYNQGYDYDEEEIEIECIDGLSTLQYFDYETPKKSFKSFSTIISELLKKCNCYTHFYLPYIYRVSAEESENFFDNCFISEQNFFDEDDEPMKCNEVLEEVCRFLNLTAIAYGEQVFFVSYNARYDEYYQYEVGKTTPKAKIYYDNFVDDDSVKDFGVQYSLGKTYNKVTVKDSLYAADKITPILDDKKLLINKNGLNVYENVNQYYHKPLLLHQCFYKFYNHKDFKPYYYHPTTLNPIFNADIKKYNDIQTNIGAEVMKVHVEDYDIQTEHVTKKLEFKPYLLFHTLGRSTSVSKPLMEVTTDIPLAIGASKGFIILSGEVIFDCDNVFIPTTSFKEEAYVQGMPFEPDTFNTEDLYLDIELKCGDLYYNGDIWVSSPSVYHLRLDNNNQNDHFYHQSFKIKNNVDYTFEFENDVDGWAIPIPSDKIFTEPITMRVLMPMHKFLNNPKFEYGEPCGFWLKDFDFNVAVKTPPRDDEESKTDTEYTTVINGDYVNDFDEEEFKICTFDGKRPNYSSVIYKRKDGTFVYLQGFELQKMPTNWYKPKIAERMFIDGIMKVYSEPPLIVEQTVNKLVQPFMDYGMYFIDAVSLDYRENKSTLVLIRE